MRAVVFFHKFDGQKKRETTHLEGETRAEMIASLFSYIDDQSELGWHFDGYKLTRENSWQGAHGGPGDLSEKEQETGANTAE